jgi:DNA-directed RNA polymerase specialized sigma24 family protein
MESEDRTERLLALILLNQMKAATQREKVVQLNLAGFSNVEIADVLQMKATVVSQMLYESRRGGKQKTKNTSKENLKV